MARKKSRINPLAVIIPIGCVLIFAAIIFVGISWLTDTMGDLTKQRDELQSYINSNRVNTSESEAAALKEVAEKKQAEAAELTGTLFNLSSYPDFYGEDYRKIFDYAGDEIELSDISYDRRTGILSFTATSYSVRKIPFFVSKLRDSGFFSDVQYEGYVLGYNSSGTAVSSPITGTALSSPIQIDEYRYAIKCLVVKPRASLPAIEKAAEEQAAEADAEKKSGE